MSVWAMLENVQIIYNVFKKMLFVMVHTTVQEWPFYTLALSVFDLIRLNGDETLVKTYLWDYA